MLPSFKAADQADVPLLLTFMQELYDFDHAPFDADKVQVALARLIVDESLGRVWLIQLADLAIGYVALTFGYSLEYHGRDAFVDELYVQGDYRRQGIGRQTLDFVTEICRAWGVQALHLEVDHQNISAQAFYRQTGFQDHDLYLLTKRLTTTHKEPDSVTTQAH